MLRILIVVAVLVAANAALFALFWLLDRRESKRQREGRPLPRITVEPPVRGETRGYRWEPLPPRGLDPVTIEDGRVKRVREEGAA